MQKNFYKCQSIEGHNRTTCCKNEEKGVTGKHFKDMIKISLYATLIISETIYDMDLIFC